MAVIRKVQISQLFTCIQIQISFLNAGSQNLNAGSQNLNAGRLTPNYGVQSGASHG